MIDLESIYLQALGQCSPERLIAVRRARSAGFKTVVAIGKCAGRLVDGLGDFERAFVAIPKGYPPPVILSAEEREESGRGQASHHPDSSPSSRLRMTRGGHPDIDDDSFRAGDQLLRFIDESDDVLFLISGGGSACVEVPLDPFTRDEIVTTNRQLVASALPIGDINIVRKHLSAIKGGRLAARVRGRSLTLVYSDVSTGAIGDVASGPTVADSSTNEHAAQLLERIGGSARVVEKLRDPKLPETIRDVASSRAEIIADNMTLTATAARLVRGAGFEPVLWPDQIETPVDEAAQFLADRCRSLRRREVLVAGGEPTVARRGSGRGGRCCELAVRFALGSDNPALFGSSDGLDGSSGIAGVVVHGGAGRIAGTLRKLLDTSDSLEAAHLIGRAVIIPPTGNNLRDLFLVAADNGVMAQP
ncbi:MAG TPA: DUF4147 domain-containing protein [Thermoanaerobaculia bacterium]